MPRAKRRMRLDLAGIRQQLDAIPDDERSKYNLLLNSRRTIGIELKNNNLSETYCSEYKTSFVDLDDRVSDMIRSDMMVSLSHNFFCIIKMISVRIRNFGFL